MGQTNEYYNLREALSNKADVKSLYLNYNFLEIKPITDSIGELNNLIEFRIQPRWFEFPKIENKKVVSEKIDDSKDKSPHRIPNGLAKCRNLKLLDISNTEVKELPEDLEQLEQLENLETLILNYAPINAETEIPKILQLKNLKEIQLAGIEISESELKQLNQIENLKILVAYEDFTDIREESVDVQIHDTYIVFTNEDQADRFIWSMPFELGKRAKKYKKGNR